MKKHDYLLIINAPAKKAQVFRYDYAATRGRGIELRVSKNGISVSAELSVSYTAKNLISADNNIFSDAVKKSLLLYLILYSESIVIKNITVIIDGKNVTPPQSEYAAFPPVYSLVEGKLNGTIPAAWNDSAFTSALLSKTLKETKDDPRRAALFAAVCAKSKKYEAERFIYFWMAFNGMYSYAYKVIKSPKSNNRLSETKQLNLFIKLLNLGFEHIDSDDAAAIARPVISLISKNDLSAVHAFKDLPDSLKKKIKTVTETKGAKKKYNVSAEGYLLVSFPYYFRCNYFHANRTLPLFSYADESELKCLHLINTLLEEFIDNNLYRFFDDGYLNSAYKERIEKINNNKL